MAFQTVRGMDLGPACQSANTLPHSPQVNSEPPLKGAFTQSVFDDARESARPGFGNMQTLQSALRPVHMAMRVHLHLTHGVIAPVLPGSIVVTSLCVATLARGS